MVKEELEKRAFAEADKVVIGKGMDRSSVVHLRHLLKNMYVCGAISETKLLSQHILELQNDKGNLTDKVRDLETQNEEIENYFVESAGYGRDKVRNFMDIVDKALEQKGERITELEAKIEKMKSQYDYAFNQLCESREIVCLMLSQYKNKKEIDYSTKERGEKLLKQGVYKYD